MLQEGSGKQWELTQESENGCQNGHGASPGWRRAVAPCVATGAYVVAQAIDA